MALLGKTPTLWVEYPQVPEYINALEDAQSKTKWNSLTMSDNLLAAFTTTLLLAEYSFPTNCPAWNGKLLHEQTRKKSKDTFLPLHRALKREQCTTAGKTHTFGSTTSTLTTHMIDPSWMQHYSSQIQETQILGKHFNALVAVSKRSNCALEQLSTETSSQYTKVSELLTELHIISTGNQTAPSVTPGTGKVALKQNLQAYQTALEKAWCF